MFIQRDQQEDSVARTPVQPPKKSVVPKSKCESSQHTDIITINFLYHEVGLRIIDRRYFTGSKQMNTIGKLGGSKMVGRLGSVNYRIAVSFSLPVSMKFRGQ